MNRRIGAVILLLVSGGESVSQPSAARTLSARLQPLLVGHKGEVAVAVKHLVTGESFFEKENTPLSTASLIKFPVMIEAYRQAETGKLDLMKMLVLRQADKVPGSGILTPHFSEGASIPLRDAIRLMIAFSDNTATNMVIDEIGLPATAKTMEAMGLPNTKLHSKVYKRETSVFPERSKEFGLGSTTAAEMMKLLELLNQRELVSKDASNAMLDHLFACDDKLKFPRFLPGVKIAFKTGSINKARNAAGIIMSKSGPIALVVLTDKNADERWTDDNSGDLLCATIAREVHEYFNPPTRDAKQTEPKPGEKK